MNDQLNFSKDSIYKEGYGIVAKLVMRNRDLSPEAKAIYSYICSFAGSGTTAFPSAELMMHELNMGDKRFYKFRKELVDRGYITIIKQRNGNRRERNIYQLETEPSKVLEHRRFESVQNESIQNESVQIESFQNEGSNINSININNLNNNNLNSNNYYSNDINLLKLYEQLGFGTINDYHANMLNDLEKQYSNTWVSEAMKECADKNKRNMHYLKSILRNWNEYGEIRRGGEMNGSTSKPTKNTESEEPKYNFTF